MANYVIDAPCGYGKTTKMIDMINENVTQNFIFITPYLDEVNRVIDNTYLLQGLSLKKTKDLKRFVQPTYTSKNETKYSSLIDLIKQGKDIASTHALFKNCNKELAELIKSREYTLILDECLNVIEDLELKKGTIFSLIKSNLVTLEDTDCDVKQVFWNNTELKDYELDLFQKKAKDAAESGNLFMLSERAFIWTFPAEILKAFKDVYICTYMFDSQIQKYYYDLYGVKYTKLTIDRDTHELKPYSGVQTFALDKIHFVEEEQGYVIGENRTALSKNWYDRNKKAFGVIKSSMKNIIKNIMPRKYGMKPTSGAGSKGDIIWTTFKEYQKGVSGLGYASGFVSCNMRSTNNYQDKWLILYPINRFIKPVYALFFNKKIDSETFLKLAEDRWALSELLQFIYRSRLRRGEDIYLFLPSKRMRNILEGFIENPRKFLGEEQAGEA